MTTFIRREARWLSSTATWQCYLILLLPGASQQVTQQLTYPKATPLALIRICEQRWRCVKKRETGKVLTSQSSMDLATNKYKILITKEIGRNLWRKKGSWWRYGLALMKPGRSYRMKERALRKECESWQKANQDSTKSNSNEKQLWRSLGGK